jgi:uncharacterized membrane protein YfcA
MDNPEIWVALIITLALLVRSSFGFGDAIFAVPILGMITDLKLGVPVLTAAATIFSFIMCVIEFKIIDWKQTALLIVSCFIGSPIGIYGLTQLDQSMVLSILGAVIISFSLFTIFVNLDDKNIPKPWGGFFGFIGGILGGAFNMNGVPVAMFGRLRHWSPIKFRAIMAGFFFPTCAIAAFGHYYAGLWTGQFYASFSYAILPSIAMLFLGKWINQRIPADRFHKIIWSIVLVLGIVLIVEHGAIWLT